MLMMPPAWYCALSSVCINCSNLFLSFPRSFAHAQHHFLFVKVSRQHIVLGRFSDVLLCAAANVRPLSPGYHRIEFDSDANQTTGTFAISHEMCSITRHHIGSYPVPSSGKMASHMFSLMTLPTYFV